MINENEELYLGDLNEDENLDNKKDPLTWTDFETYTNHTN